MTALSDTWALTVRDLLRLWRQPWFIAITFIFTGVALAGAEKPAAVRPREVSTSTGYRRAVMSRTLFCRGQSTALFRSMLGSAAAGTRSAIARWR